MSRREALTGIAMGVLAALLVFAAISSSRSSGNTHGSSFSASPVAPDQATNRAQGVSAVETTGVASTGVRGGGVSLANGGGAKSRPLSLSLKPSQTQKDAAKCANGVARMPLYSLQRTQWGRLATYATANVSRAGVQVARPANVIDEAAAAGMTESEQLQSKAERRREREVYQSVKRVIALVRAANAPGGAAKDDADVADDGTAKKAKKKKKKNKKEGPPVRVIEAGLGDGGVVSTFLGASGIKVAAFEPDPWAAELRDLNRCLNPKAKHTVKVHRWLLSNAVQGTAECAVVVPSVVDPVRDPVRGYRDTLCREKLVKDALPVDLPRATEDTSDADAWLPRLAASGRKKIAAAQSMRLDRYADPLKLHAMGSLLLLGRHVDGSRVIEGMTNGLLEDRKRRPAVIMVDRRGSAVTDAYAALWRLLTANGYTAFDALGRVVATEEEANGFAAQSTKSAAPAAHGFLRFAVFATDASTVGVAFDAAVADVREAQGSEPDASAPQPGDTTAAVLLQA